MRFLICVCVLTHVTTSIEASTAASPDLVFQSITEAANASFRDQPNVLQEGYDAGLSLKRHPGPEPDVLSKPARAAPCRPMRTLASTSKPRNLCLRRGAALQAFLVNTVIGFNGPSVHQADYPRRP